MKCPKCQFDNESDARFCNKCGSKLEIICPECGIGNILGSQFCKKCGHDLTKLTQAPPVDYNHPQSYTPKFLADRILTTRSSIEGERKLVTVLFADVANYTAISEKLDPEEIHQIMDGCFTILMDEIHRYEGTINQFTGDGIMALFGAPLALESHAQNACQAALAIRNTIGKYSQTLKNTLCIIFKMRIGLNSGPVVVGSIGDDLRMDYTAVGDTTNLASRMESMAEPDTILVSTNTHSLVRDFFEFKPLGKVELKGKTEPEKAFELIKASEISTRIEAASVKGLTKFVGRKNSLTTLVKAYEKAKAQSGQVVGILGEAGIGKSRLLLEFKNKLAKGEYTYLEGRCLHFGGSMPYLPILDILRSYFAYKQGDSEFSIKNKMEEKILHLNENLKGVLPAFQDLLSLKVEDDEYLTLEPKQRKEMIFKALRNLMIQESQDKIFFVSIDDIQWIDKTSEEFLNYLIDWLPNAKILLIFLYRPEYNHQIGSKSYYNHVVLDQLTMKSSEALVRAILKEGEVVPELSDFILKRGAGNPLFTEEFTRTLLESGSIKRKEGQYILSSKAADIEIPDTIQGIISARMDRLEENLKRTMQMASVIGREFAFPLLQAITGSNEALKSYLHTLQRLEFIYEKSLFPELEYIFKHALTQEVVYNSLLLKRRKKIHEQIGEAIEIIYRERLEEFHEMLAYHYARSGNANKAYYYLKLSGDKARAGHANWEAFQYYKEAIDVLERMPSTDSNKREGIQVRLSLAMPAMFLSYPEDSINVLKVGMQLAREVGDARSLVSLGGTLAHAYAIKGESILAIEHAERCFQEAQETQDLDLMAPVARDLTSAYMFAGEFLKAVPIFSTVIPLIEKENKRSESFGRPSSVYTFLCGLAGFIMGLLGSMNEAKSLCEKAYANALQNDDLYELAYAEFSFGIAAMAKGNGRSIVEHSQKCVDYLEQGQMTTLMDSALAILGWGYVHKGDLEKARKFAERALVATSQPGAASGNAVPTQSILTMIFSEVGELEKAHLCASEALKISKQRNVGGWEGMAYFVLGLILASMEEQRHKEAEKWIGRALMIFDEYRLRPWLANGTFAMCQVCMREGQNEKALKYLEKAKEMFKEMGMDYWLAQSYVLYAELYKQKGDQSKAKENLVNAIGLFKECGADGWVDKYEKELTSLSL